MFIDAIETAAAYTRPIHTISRNYLSETVQPGAATLYIVNAEGWALTCRHVAAQLAASGQIKSRYAAFKAESAGENKKTLKAIEKKYKLTKKMTVELENRFINCIEGGLKIEAKMHPTADVALIKFDAFTKLLCDAFPVFAKDSSRLQPGKMLCRLGFPFPEFTNFSYDKASDSIKWTDDGKHDTPRFPIEGMITRHVGNASGNVEGFELSTPGLRGQSGGPAFDTDGKVWGMQSQTPHVDLNFDVDLSVMRQGQITHVKESAILHLGRCVHVEVLKEFMSDNKVHYDED